MSNLRGDDDVRTGEEDRACANSDSDQTPPAQASNSGETSGEASPGAPGPSTSGTNAFSDIQRAAKGGQRLLGGLLFLGFCLYVASGLYAIKPEQRGVVFRFGRVLEDEALPGIHYRLPWPIDRVERLGTTEVRTLEIAFDEPKGTKQFSPGATGMSDALLTGDENLVLSTLLVQYTVVKPARFLIGTANPEALLMRLARESALTHFAKTGVDAALTTARQQMQLALRDDLQETCNALDLGVRIASFQIRRIDPPSAVASAFKSVGSAREDRQKRVEEARGERNRRIPEARGEAQRQRIDASAAAKEAVAHATGDSDRFVAAWEEYKKSKSIAAHEQYLEAVETIFPRVRKIIADPSVEPKK